MAFTAQSKGSVLDTAKLSNGVASFPTAALALAARSIVARYSGSGVLAASRSAAVGISVAQADLSPRPT
jgi:hypothetical protein